MIQPPDRRFRQTHRLDADQMLEERRHQEVVQLAQCAFGRSFFPAPSERGASRRICSLCRALAVTRA